MTRLWSRYPSCRIYWSSSWRTVPSMWNYLRPSPSLELLGCRISLKHAIVHFGLNKATLYGFNWFGNPPYIYFSEKYRNFLKKIYYNLRAEQSASVGFWQNSGDFQSGVDFSNWTIQQIPFWLTRYVARIKDHRGGSAALFSRSTPRGSPIGRLPWHTGRRRSRAHLAYRVIEAAGYRATHKHGARSRAPPFHRPRGDVIVG